MSVLIVDASVAAKWFVAEEQSQAASLVLDETNQLEAPDFLLLEMDSIICKWVRGGGVRLAEGNELRDALRQYPIRYHPFVPLLDLAFQIASQTGQTVYDCLYIALAAVVEGRMVTADRKLYDALENGPFSEHVLWVGDIVRPGGAPRGRVSSF
ncbi:MAG: type II toxin-antitoxin system VapC family toxin [Chloroflexi bacterium]|nr:type II toxin-antitoxin system VapC family toxin [Chloroflexota bacterium]